MVGLWFLAPAIEVRILVGQRAQKKHPSGCFFCAYRCQDKDEKGERCEATSEGAEPANRGRTSELDYERSDII